MRSVTQAPTSTHLIHNAPACHLRGPQYPLERPVPKSARFPPQTVRSTVQRRTPGAQRPRPSGSSQADLVAPSHPGPPWSRRARRESSVARVLAGGRDGRMEARKKKKHARNGPISNVQQFNVSKSIDRPRFSLWTLSFIPPANNLFHFQQMSTTCIDLLLHLSYLSTCPPPFVPSNPPHRRPRPLGRPKVGAHRRRWGRGKR